MTFIVKCAPVLRTWNCFCCSCSMRAATTILGWMHMLSILCNFLMTVTLLARGDDDDEPTTMDDKQRIRKVPKEILVTYLVLAVVGMVIVGLLLFGIHKKRPSFMLPYVFLDFINLIIIFLAVVIGGIFGLVYLGAVGLLIILFGGVLLAVMSFFWLVFYSYYRQLEEEKNPQAHHEITNQMYNTPSDQVKLESNYQPKSYPA